MGRLFRKRKRERKYCGCDARTMEGIMITLCELEEGIDMTTAEEEAMDIAIQAVNDIRYAISNNGKFRWNG